MKRRCRRLEDRGNGQWTVNCSCGVTFDDGERMVSCDKCGVWVHARCFRFVRGKVSFLCLKCTASASDGFIHDIEVSEFADILVELSTKTQRFPLQRKRKKDVQSGEGKQVSWKEKAKCHSDKDLTNINNKGGSVFDSRKGDSCQDRGLQIAESALSGTFHVEKERSEREKLEAIKSAASSEESSQSEGAAAPTSSTLVHGSSPNDAAEHPVGESMKRRECEVFGLLDEDTTLYDVIVEEDASSETKEEISLLKQKVAMLEAELAEQQARTKEEEENKGSEDTSHDSGKVDNDKLDKLSIELESNANKVKELSDTLNNFNLELVSRTDKCMSIEFTLKNFLEQTQRLLIELSVKNIQLETEKNRELVAEEDADQNILTMTSQKRQINDILKQHHDLSKAIEEKDKVIAAEIQRRRRMEDFLFSTEHNVNDLRDRVTRLKGRLAKKDKQLASVKSKIQELKEQKVDPADVVKKYKSSQEYSHDCITYVEEVFAKLKQKVSKKKARI